jgi:hypothetical protein
MYPCLLLAAGRPACQPAGRPCCDGCPLSLRLSPTCKVAAVAYEIVIAVVGHPHDAVAARQQGVVVGGSGPVGKRVIAGQLQGK